MYTTFSILIHLSVDIWIVSTFSLLDNATVNVGIQLSVPGPVFSSFGYIPRSGIAGSYDKSMFRLLREKQFPTVAEPFYTFTFLSVMYKGCTFSTVSSTLVIFFLKTIRAILMSVTWYLICISL